MDNDGARKDGETEVTAHGPLVQLASNLWYLQGTIRMPLGHIKRNMVIYRLGSGELVIHSAVALDESACARWRPWAAPPTWWFPTAATAWTPCSICGATPPEGAGPAAARAKVDEQIPTDASEEDVLPALGITPHKVEG
jgi:hypothetical protein